ncbi:E3 ubiquitin-protein ligase UPL1 [Apostasia shenzhenica]|uniref:HECT-type E3 ubiquitin transferase n=1 Tax=Apostasia shenzhenica TaxID=1088818 RepID=A0A2I0BGW2_9ASPA|nr:E3 ubiquitin-protein ligase UPL1 [Apostasia shenzhenica]
MKHKRRRVLEVPPRIRTLLRSVTSFSVDRIDEPLKGFVWDFDKGDFHHWVDLFNHFDSFFDKYIKPRKDLQLDNDFLGADPLFPREAVLQILRVTRIILENCTNKHLYSSFEQNLSSLLASEDADVVEASLQTLTAFLKKPAGKCSIRDSSLTSKLFSLTQGWGGKEEGLGLVACSLNNGCDPAVSKIGSTLHFEFYAVPNLLRDSGDVKHVKQGLQVIRMPTIDQCHESDLELLDKLVKEEGVPNKLRFSLFTRLRFARAFDSLAARQQYICIRLYAFIVLIQASSDADDLAVFFNNEPEFVNELVSLLSYEEEVPEKIRILATLSLIALCQDRSRQSTVLASVISGGHCGVLPSLIQKIVDSITSGSGKISIVYAEALLSLVSVLVSSTPGSLAMQEAGYIPSILPLLKVTDSQHLQLVSTAVHVIEGFLDFNNPTAALFSDLGGLDDTIMRLKIEVSFVEHVSQRNADGPLPNSKGKQIVDYSGIDTQLHSDTSVSYHRKLLLKALLRAISLATYVPGSSGRIDGSEESVLPHCLSVIFRRARDFGGGVFSLAAIVMSDLIHKDPTCYPVLDAADLPRAFLDAVMNGVLCSSEAVACILQCLDALCLNSAGLQLVRDYNALRCFVKIFTSRSYIRALSGDIPGSLSNFLDELMRHASSLRISGVDMLVEILSTLAKIGSGSESSQSTDCLATSNHAPMDTDSEKPLLSIESGSSGQMIEALSDTIVSVESFLPDCISNAARLLETVLQNADLCRLFIEKKGIEAVLKLFTLPSVPISVSIGQCVSVAFKNFSPQHSVALARTVCSFIREHLKLMNELLDSVYGPKLVEADSRKQMEKLKCMSTLEGLISLVNFLLKGTTAMMSELGSSNADILIELGKVYREVLWQISLTSDLKVEEKNDADQDPGVGEASVSSSTTRDSDDDGSTAPAVRYINPASIRNSSTSAWNAEHSFVSYVPAAGARNAHRHGRHGLSRIRGSRLSRHLDILHTDSEISAISSNCPVMPDIKKKNPDALVSEVLLKLAFTIHSFHATLVKGLGTRRRTDSSSLSPTSKCLVTALAKVFHDALSYSGHSISGFEMSLSVKCRYLGKVVEDMSALVLDGRRRACNTALVNSFYVNGTFKELLNTYEATSQLLWTLPLSFSSLGHEQGACAEVNKVTQSSWLLDTLQSYCRLLEYHVNSSLLLSPSSPSQTQLLVQPVATGLSIGLFPIPRDPEAFVRLLQSQVLDAILPLWNHPMFPSCSPLFISSVVSLVTHIYSGVGSVKRGHTGITSTVGPRVLTRPLDESTIATIVEMGFSRIRAEEALRNVGANSVELATDWLFSHPEELVQEDVQLAQALALSLGNSSDTSKDDSGDETKNFFTDDKGTQGPPVDEIIATSMKLFQSNDSVVFPLTDLLVTLCNRDKGKDRPKVVSHLIEQLKHYSSDYCKDAGKVFPISHILAILLSEDSSTREIAADNEACSAILDILENIKARIDLKTGSVMTKFVSALLLVLNFLLQPKVKVPEESSDGLSQPISDLSRADVSLPIPASAEDMRPASGGCEKESGNLFETILGKSTGYLSFEETQKAMAICCDFLKQQVPATVMQSVLLVCARLTKTYAIANQFLESGGLAAIFNVSRACIFPGFDTLASATIRHLLEDPQTLQTAMELEIRQSLSGSHNRHASRLSPRLFLTSMAPVISRDPPIFMRAAAVVCQLEFSGGRTTVVLSKEREKDKPKVVAENGTPVNELLRLPESKLNETPGKCSRSYKRVPPNLSQVIDQLLEIIMSYPLAKKHEDSNNSSTMEVDEHILKEKGKSKVDEMKLNSDDSSEKSALLAKVTFVLRLMSDIILMYVHAVVVVLKRDSEMCSIRGPSQGGCVGYGGVIHQILHELLPLSSEKITESSGEWMQKLSEKASWFLVVLCGRSNEGRKRVINEILKAFSSFSDMQSNSSKSILLPDKKVLAFTDLVYSILSKNSSSNLPGPGCSPDIAKTMIDGGMLQSLSVIIGCIDLDHPDAPKVVNLILKALESLTRAANSTDQVLKLDGMSRRSFSGAHERLEEQNTTTSRTGVLDQNANQHASNVAIQTEETQIHEFLHNGEHDHANPSQPMEHAMRMDGEGNPADPSTEAGVQFMHQDMDESGILQNTNEVGLDYQVEQRMVDEMGDDDEDIGDDGDDDDDGEEDDDDEDIAEDGAGLMSLADTDVDDHDVNLMHDEYTDMIDEDDDLPENHVIEVRWREGLTGLDQLRVFRDSGDVGGFIDISSEPFRGVSTDDIFRFHRSLGVDRRRQSGSRTFVDRNFDVNAFQHPLLLRSSQAGETSTSIWPSAGSSSRNSGALSVGGFDVAHLYMLDSGLPPENTSGTIFGNNLVGAAPSSLIDFSLGMDSLQMGGRRGAGDGQWTDDGQPQAGNHSLAIALAVEEQFVAQLRCVTSDSNPLTHRPPENSAINSNPTSLLNANNLSPERRGNQPLMPGDHNQEIGYEAAEQPGAVACGSPVAANDSVSVSQEGEDALTERQVLLYAPSISAVNNSSSIVVGNEVSTTVHSDAFPQMVMPCVGLQNIGQQMQYDSEVLPVPHSIEPHSECREEHTGLGSHSCTQAGIVSGSAVPEIGDGSDIPQEANQENQLNVSNESSSLNAIDPTFLEALPEDLRAEVLASQQTQSVQTSTYAPPAAEEIDPEFLAALPPEIQAEVLAQQRVQRDAQAQQTQGQPVDMDNASIIATFPPELREEVLLTSSEAVLSALPSALLAEAQLLRDRAASHYSARSSLFGGRHMLGGRRLTVERQTMLDRGVGATIGPKTASSINSLRIKEIEGMPLLEANSLKSVIRLLRLAQPLGKGLLQRLLLNLCAHSITRASLVTLLVDMIKLEADKLSGTLSSSQRLYGCQWNVVYGRPQPSDGLPPLLSRRVLEMLTYLATNHSAVANILFYFDPSLACETSTSNTNFDVKEDKVKDGCYESKDALTCQIADIPLVIFLKLLSRPLFLCSNAHLEQVMALIQVIIDNAVTKIDCDSHPALVSNSSGTQIDTVPSDSLRDSAIVEQNPDKEAHPCLSNPQTSVVGKKSISPYGIFLQLPKTDLCNLCSILAHSGLSEKVYSLVAEVLMKLAIVVTPHRKFFAFELAGLARNLSASAVAELVALRSSDMLGFSAGSVAGAAVLRVLQTLSAVSMLDGSKSEEFVSEHDELSILVNLNVALEPLWRELSDCISASEAKLGQGSTFSSSLQMQDAANRFDVNSSASPLPPGTQRLLPFIEAFFILCEKLQMYEIMLADDSATWEVKEFARVSSSAPVKASGTGGWTFSRIVEKHRRLLNVFIRQNPSLLEKSLSMMLKVPRLIDFDNKRAYFRARIRQQHDQHPSAPLRISVRRAYVLEDSYNQLRLRSAQDLQGRLTVQFQGEEGIDAGGLTREWYQLLSRVIFDKGALLFTTVGNNSTFQPNPNSVYQTEHLSYFKFIGRLVAKALFDGQLLDVYFTRSFYKHILGAKVTYHDIEAVDPDYYKNLKWMLENDISDLPDLTFSMDADEEKLILYEKNEVTDYELKPGGRNIWVTEETKHEYVDLVAEHTLSTAIRPQINSFLEGFNELISRDLISIFNDKELELLISGLPEIDFDDLKANTEYTGYTTASTVIEWFWEVIKSFNKEDMARFLQFVTGTSKVPLEGFKALQGISGPQRFQIHKAYGAPDRLPSAHTCFNQLDLPEYLSKEQLEARLLLAIHEASEGFGFG